MGRAVGPGWGAPLREPHSCLGTTGTAPRQQRRLPYLLGQRGHDVLLLPDAYARVVLGVVVDHGEPQDTAHAAHAAWEAGVPPGCRGICELGDGGSPPTSGTPAPPNHISSW